MASCGSRSISSAPKAGKYKRDLKNLGLKIWSIYFVFSFSLHPKDLFAAFPAILSFLMFQLFS